MHRKAGIRSYGDGSEADNYICTEEIFEMHEHEEQCESLREGQVRSLDGIK